MSLRIALFSAAFFLLQGCATSTHAVVPSDLGTPRRSSEMLAVMDQPGPIDAETKSSADWVVDRSGLIDLDDPKAKAAGLVDGDEPIHIFFHVVRHPTRGTYVIDTGAEKALRDSPDTAALRGMVASFAHTDRMKVTLALGDWLAQEKAPISGVFLTHAHIDHIAGIPDLPKATPIFTGPGETTQHAFLNLFVQGTTDRELDGKGPLREWPYAADADGRFPVVDVFSDGSFWAISVPGHTPGSTAYLARTTKGPVLFVGDTSHTKWGWENHVAPGSFTADHEANAQSLEKLERLVSEHPQIDVRLGHQWLHEPAAAASNAK